jgi:hypothetical protein
MCYSGTHAGRRFYGALVDGISPNQSPSEFEAGRDTYDQGPALDEIRSKIRDSELSGRRTTFLGRAKRAATYTGLAAVLTSPLWVEPVTEGIIYLIEKI